MDQMCECELEKTVYVSSARIEETTYYLVDNECLATVWGCRISFSDGQTIYIPDLCDRREYADLFVKRLQDADLRAEFLQDIVDDFLSEIYGVHMI